MSLYTERFWDAVRSTRYVSWRSGVVGAGVEVAADGGGGVDACCAADVVASVVRSRVVVKKEGRKSKRLLSATEVVRSGIWRSMMAVIGRVGVLTQGSVEKKLIRYCSKLGGGR